MPSPTRRRTAAGDAPATSTQILDVAERLAQTRGFNGFSYADIAAELGITKASLHYHFATKADLGRALIERYSTAFAEALSQIEASGVEARAQLTRYVQLYADVLSDGRICLCGMLAAEYTTLPDPMQRAIRRFFDVNEAWLTRVLEAGRRARNVAFEGDASGAARMLTGALEGAMLLARSYGDPTRFAAASAHLLREFSPALNERHARASRPRPAVRGRSRAGSRRG
jgi:TetR/AcrR family transcriptional regulator, transcriptional repressor for nem operon